MPGFKLFFNDIKIRKKLFLTYFFITIIPVAVLGVYSYFQANKFLYEQEKMNYEDSVSKMAADIHYLLEKYSDVVEYIAFNKRIQQIFSNNYLNYKGLFDDLQTELLPVYDNLMQLNKEIKQITLYAENDLPEYSNLILSSEKVKNTVWYENVMGSHESAYYFYDGELFIARKFIDLYSLKTLGVICIQLDTDKFFQNIAMQNEQGDMLFVVDSKNKVIFRHTPHQDSNLHAIQTYLSYGSSIIKINGRNFFQMDARIPDCQWVVYSLKPESSIVINADNILFATIIIVLVCLCFLVLVIWIFTNTFVKRIYTLNNKIKLVTAGNLRIKISSRDKDEIGELTNGIGSMLGSINKLIDEVYHSKVIQREAEMKALQAQINPHFLYNTLSLINWKALTINAYEISNIATTISRFYRTVLNKGNNIISIKDELENVKMYVRIQQIMHDYNFDVVYDMDEGIWEYSMINLILQPIVENAIEHGIDYVEGQRGVLNIRGLLQQDNIVFVVEDNGPGMDEEMARSILTIQKKGYGMKNVQERLKIFFGEPYGVSVQSQSGGGTKVQVCIPRYSPSIGK